eukprot:scaffold10348_cov125-Isochrysis_galbana.AAC.3
MPLAHLFPLAVGRALPPPTFTQPGPTSKPQTSTSLSSVGHPGLVVSLYSCACSNSRFAPRRSVTWRSARRPPLQGRAAAQSQTGPPPPSQQDYAPHQPRSRHAGRPALSALRRRIAMAGRTGPDGRSRVTGHVPGRVPKRGPGHVPGRVPGQVPGRAHERVRGRARQLSQPPLPHPTRSLPAVQHDGRPDWRRHPPLAPAPYPTRHGHHVDRRGRVEMCRHVSTPIGHPLPHTRTSAARAQCVRLPSNAQQLPGRGKQCRRPLRARHGTGEQRG